MKGRSTFWQTFIGVIIRPLSTFQRFQEDDRAALKGLLALLLVLGVYTLILAIFILQDYPAMAPSILPIATEDLYRYQIWYQGPLFIGMTMILTGLLLLLVRAKGQTESFAVAFARMSFATTVPFALTTMAVELVISLLVLAQVFQPPEILVWGSNGGWLSYWGSCWQSCMGYRLGYSSGSRPMQHPSITGMSFVIGQSDTLQPFLQFGASSPRSFETLPWSESNWTSPETRATPARIST